VRGTKQGLQWGPAEEFVKEQEVMATTKTNGGQLADRLFRGRAEMDEEKRGSLECGVKKKRRGHGPENKVGRTTVCGGILEAEFAEGG